MSNLNSKYGTWVDTKRDYEQLLLMKITFFFLLSLINKKLKRTVILMISFLEQNDWMQKIHPLLLHPMHHCHISYG